MPRDCIVCGAANSTCGVPTAHKTIAVDEPIRGVRVAGNELVPDISPEKLSAVLGDMDEEEREEFIMMSQKMAQRRNRLRPRENGMAVNHTYLSYVRGTDGIVRKMHPDDAKRYVEMYGDQEGVEIVREGGAEVPDPQGTEVIGATKATVGPMFDDNGRQIQDVQPATTRVFAVSDAGNRNVVSPGIGVPVTSGATPEGSKAEESEKPAAPRHVSRPKPEND